METNRVRARPRAVSARAWIEVGLAAPGPDDPDPGGPWWVTGPDGRLGESPSPKKPVRFQLPAVGTWELKAWADDGAGRVVSLGSDVVLRVDDWAGKIRRFLRAPEAEFRRGIADAYALFPPAVHACRSWLDECLSDALRKSVSHSVAFQRGCELLYSLHAVPLKKYLERRFGRLGEDELVDGMLQDAMLQFLGKVKAFLDDPRGRPFGPFFFVLLLHAIANYFRKKRLVPLADEHAAALPAPGPEPAEEVAWNDLWAYLEAAFPDKLALVKVKCDGATYADIARMLNIPLAQAIKTVTAALRLLKTVIERQGGSGS